MTRTALIALVLACAAAPALAEECRHSAPRALELDLAGARTVMFEVGPHRLRVDASAAPGGRGEKGGQHHGSSSTGRPGGGQQSEESNASGPVTLILRSRTQRLRFLSTIRTGLMGVLVVTLLPWNIDVPRFAVLTSVRVSDVWAASSEPSAAERNIFAK